jgi:hypothetical protein
VVAETLTRVGGAETIPLDMSNVLGDEKKQQILALGRLGWSLRRVQLFGSMLQRIWA